MGVRPRKDKIPHAEAYATWNAVQIFYEMIIGKKSLAERMWFWMAQYLSDLAANSPCGVRFRGRVARVCIPVQWQAIAGRTRGRD